MINDLHKYQLAEDENLCVAFIRSKQDEVAIGSSSAIVFEEELLQALSELSQEFPERFLSTVASGDAYTFIQRCYAFQIGSTTVRQWINTLPAQH